jgi:predicted RNase H-like HicB family nuclease
MYVRLENDMKQLMVDAIWDMEAKVWVAESDDIPGLVAEAKTLDDLRGKVLALAPELFELNGGLEAEQKQVSIQIRAHHEETALLPVA